VLAEAFLSFVVLLQGSALLGLPDPCLLGVLRCCAAEDLRSLFNAARAHSRLQKAVIALDSISTTVSNQQQLDSLLLYLSNHAAVVKLQLEGPPYMHQPITHIPPDMHRVLRQLPSLQLQSLSLHHLMLQMAPDAASRGVLQPGMNVLTELRLTGCKLLDENAGLGAALPLLSQLQHLTISHLETNGSPATVSVKALGRLKQLT
jgi:hypothetical protein